MLLQMTRPAQGGLRQERKVEATNNHLANADTTGFKKDVVSFDRMFKARLNTDYSQGPLRQTDNKLDVALQEEGFFKINTPDGMRYSRDGRFLLNTEGVLVNQQGFPVQGDNGDITINGERIDINKAGEIFVDGAAVDVLDIITFEDIDVLEKQGDNLLTIKDGEEADEIDPDRIAVKQGALEASNVQVVHEMVSMIDHHRMYESFQKMMWTFDEIDGKAITEVGKPQ